MCEVFEARRSIGVGHHQWSPPVVTAPQSSSGPVRHLVHHTGDDSPHPGAGGGQQVQVSDWTIRGCQLSSIETIVQERDEPLSSLACHLTSQRDDCELRRRISLSTCASSPIPETRRRVPLRLRLSLTDHPRHLPSPRCPTTFSATLLPLSGRNKV